jgi:photosystem II stability/assembly factor-like uncharacterized protein
MIKKLLLFNLLCISIPSIAQWIPTSGTYYGSATSFASKGDTILITDPATNGHTSGVYRSVDGGVLWKLICRTPEFLKSIVISGTNFFAASNTDVFFSTDYGEHWVKRDNGLTLANNTILFAENKKVYLSKADGLFVTSNDGLDWTKVNSSAPVEAISCTLKFGSKLFAGTLNRGLLSSDDNGTTWDKATADLANIKIVSLTTDGTNLFAATDGLGVFMSGNNGVTWSAINTNLTTLSMSSIVIVDSTLFAGTMDGLFYSVDKGTTWTKQAEIPGSVNTCYVHNKTIFVAVPSDAVYSSSDQGKSWDRLTNGRDQPLSLTLLAENNDLYVVSGSQWEKIYKTSNL